MPFHLGGLEDGSLKSSVESTIVISDLQNCSDECITKILFFKKL